MKRAGIRRCWETFSFTPTITWGWC